MDEAEWMSSADTRKMLECLVDRMSDRKLRLFACACCRRIWRLITDGRSRSAIDVVERYDVGLATDEEFAIARAGARDAVLEKRGDEIVPAEAVCWAADTSRFRDGKRSSRYAHARAALAVGSEAGDGQKDAFAHHQAKSAELKAQADLLREILGNPFRPIALDATRLTPTVKALALAAYDERALPAGTIDTDLLAVLADALEDAGCNNSAVLEHLRGPGPHVLGCWAIDQVLGLA